MSTKTFWALILCTCLLGLALVQPLQADRARPQLLDGDLIEADQPPPPVQPPTPRPQTEQTVTLLKEFTVSLPVTPKTGLLWRLANHDRRFLQLRRHRYQKPPHPGAPGQQQFDFLPLRSGRTTLTFVAQPPLVRTIAQEHQHVVVVK